MAASIETQQKWIRDTLLSALDRNAKALDRMARSLEQSTSAHPTPRRLETVDADHA
jgi:hypothetical protein